MLHAIRRFPLSTSPGRARFPVGRGGGWRAIGAVMTGTLTHELKNLIGLDRGELLFGTRLPP